MAKLLDLAGEVFGRLTCIESAGSKNGERLWKCKCECGMFTIVSTASLRSGNTKSCGCVRREALIKRNKVHGLSTVNGKKTRLYNIWVRMKQRCYDKNASDYYRYGGKGVKVCDEWKNNYENFHNWAMNNGYDDTLTIERKDFRGDYNPANCTWIPIEKQARNKKTNHFIEYKGKRKTLAEWSELTNINSSTIRQRLNLGWTVEKALTTPVRRNKNANEVN